MMMKKRCGLAMHTLLLLFLALVAVAACRADYETYCEKKIACTGGNDKDHDACRADESAAQEIAAAYGCDELWLNYEACAEKSTCREHFLDTSKCAREEKALIDCKRVASGLKPAPNDPAVTAVPDGGAK